MDLSKVQRVNRVTFKGCSTIISNMLKAFKQQPLYFARKIFPLCAKEAAHKKSYTLSAMLNMYKLTLFLYISSMAESV